MSTASNPGLKQKVPLRHRQAPGRFAGEQLTVVPIQLKRAGSFKQRISQGSVLENGFGG
jgi:hypothetical protein